MSNPSNPDFRPSDQEQRLREKPPRFPATHRPTDPRAGSLSLRTAHAWQALDRELRRKWRKWRKRRTTPAQRVIVLRRIILAAGLIALVCTWAPLNLPLEYVRIAASIASLATALLGQPLLEMARDLLAVPASPQTPASLPEAVQDIAEVTQPDSPADAPIDPPADASA